MNLHLLIQSVAFTGRFLSREISRLSIRLLLPIVLGGLVSYVCLDLFFFELQQYLVAPSDRLATLILGVVAGGLVIEIFLFSVAATTVVSLALGRAIDGWRYFPITRQVGRVYAAYLRWFLLLGALVALYGLASLVAYRLELPYTAALGAPFVVAIGILVVRCGLLAAPAACAASAGPVIRRAWALSSKAPWQIAAVVVLGLAIGYATQMLGETIMLFARGEFVVRSDSFIHLVEAYRPLLGCLVIVQTFSCTMMMMTVLPSSAEMFRRLLVQQEVRF